jgi:hypothetical protein
MRAVLTSLIFAAGLAGAAQAQAPAATQPATAGAAPPGTTAPPATAPAASPPATAPAATTGAPPATGSVDPDAAPPAGATPEAPPPLPTTGDGAKIVEALDKVCIPAVRGQGLEAAAKAAGLKKNRRDETWTMPLGGSKDYAIIFLPQYSQTNVCQAEVHYAIGQEKPMISALAIWTFIQKPMLILGANYVATDADGVKRVRRSWESQDQKHAVNFSTERKPDDTPLNPKYDQAKLFYQERQ